MRKNNYFGAYLACIESMSTSFVCSGGGLLSVLHGSRRASLWGAHLGDWSCSIATRPGSTKWMISSGKTYFTVECKRGGRYTRSGHGEGRRPHRVGELIRREVGKIIDDTISTTYRSETGGALLISVVDVKCSSDLRNARVSISVLGSNDQRREAVTHLRQSAKEIRFQLAQSIRMKYVPDLSFVESELADATNTVQILNMLAKEREEKAQRTSELVDSAVGVDVGAPSSSMSTDDSLDYDTSAEDAIIFDDEDGSEDDVDGLHIVDIEDAGDDEIDDDEEDEQTRSRDKNRSSKWFNDTQTNKTK